MRWSPLAQQTLMAHLAPANPDVRYAEPVVRGYRRLDVAPAGATCRLRGLADARDPGSSIGDLKTFQVAAGRGGIA